MNTARRIAKNTVSLITAEVVSKALMFFFVVYIARILGDSEFGKISFAIAYTGIFSIIVNLGLDALFVREVSRDKDSAAKYFGGFLWIRAIAACLTFLLIVVSINMMGYPADTKIVVYIMGAYVIINSIIALYKSVFQSFEHMEYQGFLKVLDRVILVPLGLILLYFGYGIIHVSGAYLVTGIITLAAGTILSFKRFVKPDLAWNPSFMKESITTALPFIMTAVFALLYFNIDIVMLSIMKTDAVVGWYNAAYQIIAALLFIPGMFMSALYPVMSTYYKTSKETLILVYEKAYKYLVIAALPFGVGSMILADKFILLIYGEAFAQSANALKYLIWSGALLFPNYMFFGMLLAINKEKIRLWISAGAAGFNIILNFFLIPGLGHIGAAISTVITQFVMLILSYVYISRCLAKIDLVGLSVKPVVSALVMGLVVYSLREVNIALVVSAGAVVYGLSLLLLKTFTKDDRIIVDRILRIKD